jgi:NTE family protein
MKLQRSNILLQVGLSLLVFSLMKAQQSTPGPTRSNRYQPEFVESRNRIHGFVDHKATRRPKVALVLSGGGSRGVAAVGVFRSFERNNIPIDLIVGTSMGSIAGGLYASGYTPEQLQQLVESTDWNEVISYADESARRDLFFDQKLKRERSFLALRFQGFEPIIPSAFSSGQNLTNFLNLLSLQALYHPNPSFDSLEVPYRAVTTDLVSGKQIVIDKGDISNAMRGSMAVPLLFTPVAKDSMQLVDGGLISNIPVNVARDLGANLVVALDVTSPLRPREMLNQFWEVGDQIMGIMMQASNREQLANADIVIRPNLDNHLSSDFTNLGDVILHGERSADAVVDSIRIKIKRLETADTTRGPSHMFRSPRFVAVPALPRIESTKPPRLSSPQPLNDHELQTMLGDIYETGEFESVDAVVDEYPDSSVVSFHVSRYPKISTMEVRGNTRMVTDSILKVFAPLLGKNLNAHSSENALKGMLNLYRDRGYSLARIKDIQFDRNSGKAILTVDEGVIYRIDIQGAAKTKDYVVWRELPFSEQEVFEISKVAQGIRNLNGTNLFEQVSTSTHQEGELNVVTINVRERSTELVRLGMRIDQERNFQPSIDVRDDNFLGMGTELGIGFYGGLRNRNYFGEFKATRIFNSYFTFNLRGYYKLHDYYTYADEPTIDELNWRRFRVGEYREQRLGASASFGTQLERLGMLTMEGRLEDQRLWNVSGNPLKGNESYAISAVKLGLAVDTQDRIPFPKAGILLNLSYESALVKIIDAVGFTKFYISYESYQTAFKRQTLHPKIVFGFADETLPITEQFTLGGQHSFFGLAENDSRGRQLFCVSLEYQSQLPFKLFFDTYFKARYDLGSTWSSAEEIRLVDLRHGIGVGLALDTPIGPAEFSVGRSFFTRKDILDRPVSFGPIMVYFSIGYVL